MINFSLNNMTSHLMSNNINVNAHLPTDGDKKYLDVSEM
jgi:hypothetical protein